MKICSIICGAPNVNIPKEKVEGLVIAADRGFDYCMANGITPSYAVGDFDSSECVVPPEVTRVVVPAEKDDTDTHLAIDIGRNHQCDEFRLFCALGGRLDHTIANIQTLLELKNSGIPAFAYGDGCEVFFLKDETVTIPKYDGYLSVLSFSPTAQVTIKGVKYPLDNYTIESSFPLGISNVITDDYAEITAISGDVLIIRQDFDV